MVDRTIVYRLQADVAAFEANMRHAGTTVRKTAGDMTAATADGVKFRRGLTDLGNAAGKVGLVAAAGLGASIKAAVDWESAFAGVSKTVNGTATEMASLESELRGLAKTMPATHEEIAATAEAAGQLGVARENIVDFTKTMVQLGETTNLTADDAATSIAQFMNVMKSTAGDVDEIGNTLVDLGNKGASTESQILDMAKRLAGAGSLVGATESDVLALSSAMANLGIQSQLGGGAIQRVFTNIYQAAANGADGLTGFADVAGVTAQDFADQWANDPVRAFDAFLQGLGRVKESGGNVVGTLDELGISGTQNLQVMLRLAGAGDTLTTSLAQSSNAWEQNTALTDEYRKRSETTASQVQVSWNQIKDAGIEAGNGLLPVVAEVAGRVGDLATAFGNLPGPVKSSVTGLAGVTAVLGGGLWFTAKTVSGVSNMRKALADLNVTADGTRSKLGGLATAATVATGIYALSGAVVALANSMDESLPGLDTLQSRLVDIANTPAGFSISLGSEFDSLGGSIDRLADPSKWQRLNEMAGSFNDAILPGDARDKGIREATAEIGQLDAALAALATSGHADTAADALKRVTEGLSADQAAQLLDRLPQYDEALAGVATQAKLTGGATDGMTGATKGLGDSLSDTAAQAQDFGDVLDRLNEKLSGRADMRSYQAAIDDFSKSLKDNGKTFDINTEKGRANQAALDGIAGTALKVAENMKGAARTKFLTNAIDDIRTMAKNMGLPKSEVRKLIELLREANQTDVNPNIKADTSAAQAQIRAVQAQLDSIDRFIPVNIHVSRTGGGGEVPYVSGGRAQANGGTLDFYGNGGMRENHVAQVAPAGAWRIWAEPETGGEAYIPLAPSKRERSIDIWEEVGARLGVKFERFAAGSAGKESEAAKKAREARDKARRAAEERARREEEKRQRRLDGQRTKDLLASNLADEAEQARLELLDAQRRLRSAKKADRPRGEINDLRLGVKQERTDRRETRRDERTRIAEEAEAERTRIAEEAEAERTRIAEEAAKSQQEHDDAVLAGQERAWDQATSASQERLDLAQQEYDAVEASMQRIGDVATAAFSGSFFTGGGEHGLWNGAGGGGAGGDWRSRANASISGLEERDALISQLEGLGLTGTALEDLLGNQDNAGIAAMIKAGEIGDYASLFARQQALVQSVGQHAGIAGYGADQASAAAVVAQATAQLADLTAAILAARPITVLEAVSATATANELVRLLAMAGSS